MGKRVVQEGEFTLLLLIKARKPVALGGWNSKLMPYFDFLLPHIKRQALACQKPFISNPISATVRPTLTTDSEVNRVKAHFCVEIGLSSSVETAAVRAKAEEIGTLLRTSGLTATVEAAHCSERRDNSPAIRIVASTQYQLREALEAITSGWMISTDWARRRGKFPLSFSLQVDTGAEQ